MLHIQWKSLIEFAVLVGLMLLTVAPPTCTCKSSHTFHTSHITQIITRTFLFDKLLLTRNLVHFYCFSGRTGSPSTTSTTTSTDTFPHLVVYAPYSNIFGLQVTLWCIANNSVQHILARFDLQLYLKCSSEYKVSETGIGS